ncbi:hypothetical protein QFZ96_006998 [Paraburkholderia youngii]
MNLASGASWLASRVSSHGLAEAMSWRPVRTSSLDVLPRYSCRVWSVQLRWAPTFKSIAIRLPSTDQASRYNYHGALLDTAKNEVLKRPRTLQYRLGGPMQALRRHLRDFLTSWKTVNETHHAADDERFHAGAYERGYLVVSAVSGISSPAHCSATPSSLFIGRLFFQRETPPKVSGFNLASGSSCTSIHLRLQRPWKGIQPPQVNGYPSSLLR